MALLDIHADHGMLAGMARTGRPKAVLTFTEEERATLERWARRATSAQALALRSKIVLACADGQDNKQVAAVLGCHQATAGKWRARFIQRRLDGVRDEDRPGRPPSVTDEQAEAVAVATLEETPKDAAHWSRASMARKSGLSKSTVGRAWKAFKLKPHLADGFKVSTDPLFIEKVHDVVGLYLSPPEHAVWMPAASASWRWLADGRLLSEISTSHTGSEPPASASASLLWLCSDQSSFVTGIVLPIDGGQSAGNKPPQMYRQGQPMPAPAVHPWRCS
jgi:transposase